MTSKAQHCDEYDLALILHGEETAIEFQEVASHVECCKTCQLRLTKLAGDEHSWSEVADVLSDAGYQATASSATESSLDQAKTFGLEKILGPASHPELLGRIGRYDVERVIGSGGMGVVLRGHDSELNRPVAIKVLASHLAHNGAARQRFARESRAAAAVVHEHVVAIHDVQVSSELPYLVMQYVAGESLQSRVDREGPLSNEEIFRIGLQTARALAAAHEQGVVHRDIKPANILLEHGVERALVTDFGLARTVDDASLTQTGVIAGTPHYMSPEQASGISTDHRTDLFSLGCVLYFMATGRPPFRGERAMGVLHRICSEPHRGVWEVNPQVTDRLSDIIDRLLEKSPDRRFASASDAAASLQQGLQDLQTRVRHRSKLRRFWRSNYRVVFATTGLIGLILIGSVIGANLIKKIGDSTGSQNPVSSNSNPSFSLAVLKLASPDESEQWQGEMSELINSLEQMQMRISELELASMDPWYSDLQWIHEQVGEMESSTVFQMP